MADREVNLKLFVMLVGGASGGGASGGGASGGGASGGGASDGGASGGVVRSAGHVECGDDGGVVDADHLVVVMPGWHSI